MNSALIRPTVLGGGSWGTALALVLARQGNPVRLWVRNMSLAHELRRSRINTTYLPGVPLPASVEIDTELRGSVADADSLIFAVPSQAMRSTAAASLPFLPPGSVLVSAAKGFEVKTLQRMSQVLVEVCSAFPVAALSGPSFAREVADNHPTAVVAASDNLAVAHAVQRLFGGSNFRVYANSDLCGVEFGGAVKNVIAIAAGVCQGLQLGANPVAALVTRGLAEMTRLAQAHGANAQTLSGLAGLGDLVLTCTGNLSRNRQVGVQLAQGRTIAEITAGLRTVAEGILTTHSVVELGHRAMVSLPIAEQMAALLTGRSKPAEAIRTLMDRSLKGE